MNILGIIASSSNHPYWMGLLASSTENKYITKSPTGDVHLGLLGPVGNAVKLNNLGVLQWQKTAGIDNFGVAVDSSGNTYIAGQASSSAQLIKLDSSGAIVWQRKTTTAVIFTSLAVDSSSNVYVGTSEGTLVKYNSSGTIQWQRKLASTAYNAITVDGSGNVYATGYSVVGSRSDIQVVKYNSSGTIQWQTALSTGYTGTGATNTRGYDIKLDSTGNVIIAGIGVISGYNYFHVIKLNSSGVLQWQRYMTTLSGGAYGIAVDSSDNIYVTGYSQPFGDSVGLIFKYNSSGTIQWKRQIFTIVSGTTYGNMYGVTTGSSGEFYATGVVRVSVGVGNGITVKLPTDGSLTSTNTIGSLSVTYSASSLSEAAASLTNTTSTFSESAGTLADTTGTQTASNSTYTNTVKSL